ncbi:MAG: SPW repeat domain-containing protein [Egibacteraceae bacterium]
MSPIRLLPWVLHEAIEYVAGVFVILAPFLFSFQQEPAAFPVFIGVGVLILVVAILSKGPAGVLGLLPHPLHAGLDYVLAFFLLLAPLIFGFDQTALTISILLGLAHLIITLITRFPPADTADTHTEAETL